MIIELLQDIMDELEDESGNGCIYADQVITRLEDNGYMIVPIEDPTNLFGVQEDGE